MARKAVRAQPHETPYQRRIRLYKERHPGATTQEARGKKPREHVERARREKEKSGLTPYQRSKIKADAIQQAYRAREHGVTAAEVEAGFTRMVRERGWDAYKDIRAFINAQHKARTHQGKVVVLAGRAANLAKMERLAAKYGIELEWLFYG